MAGIRLGARCGEGVRGGLDNDYEDGDRARGSGYQGWLNTQVPTLTLAGRFADGIHCQVTGLQAHLSRVRLG